MALPRGGIVAHPIQQRGHHGFLAWHIDVIRCQQSVHVLKWENKKLLATDYLQKVLLVDEDTVNDEQSDKILKVNNKRKALELTLTLLSYQQTNIQSVINFKKSV